MRLALRLDKIQERHDNGLEWVQAATAMERTGDDLDGYSMKVMMCCKGLWCQRRKLPAVEIMPE